VTGADACLASQLLPADVARIEASAGWRKERVEVLDVSVGRVIVKGHRPRRKPARHRALNAVARLVGVPILRAVPVHGGAASQAVEIRRLRALRAAGVRVPELLHVAPEYFVMRWLGGNHLASALSEGVPAAFDLWREAANAILDTHRRGQYLSQCFGRNVIVGTAADVAGFQGFIDFEDDPLEVMGLPEAQVRDWLIYLQSTLWQVPATPSQIDAVLDACLQGESESVRRLFALACRRLAWLRRLPAHRRWGRDTLAVRAVATLAHRWRQRHGA